jgi:hypothetical protein
MSVFEDGLRSLKSGLLARADLADGSYPGTLMKRRM